MIDREVAAGNLTIPAGDHPPAGPGVVALFDLDLTLTRTDTFLDFCLRTAGLASSLRSVPQALQALLRTPGHWNAELKTAVLCRLFADWPWPELTRAGEGYATERLPQLLRPVARARLDHYRQAGSRVVVVTASPDLWIAPWTRAWGLELLATGLEVVAGHLTGRLQPPNCYGPEKARRVQELLGPDLNRYTIHAYGDSSGDRELLELADLAFFRSFSHARDSRKQPWTST